VVTGSPLGGEADLRHRYQQIYFEAAEAVREPARLALRELAQVPDGRVGRFLNHLVAQAARLAQCLVPEPRIAVAMNGEAEEVTPDLSWPDVALLRILDLTDAGEGRIEVRCIGTAALSVEVWRDDVLLDKANLLPGDSGTVAWDDEATHLRLADTGGRTLRLGLREPA
jgi:hypothetical protein